MGVWPVLAAAAVLAVAGCGSGSDDGQAGVDGGSAEDNTAVTAAGADSAIVDEGDTLPEDGAGDGASTVRVTVDVPDDMDRAGIAIVALEDVSLSDVASVEIGRVELPVADLVAQGNTVDIFLPLPLDGSTDVAATVHIDIDESGSFSPGDWISNELAIVTAETAGALTVGIVQI